MTFLYWINAFMTTGYWNQHMGKYYHSIQLWLQQTELMDQRGQWWHRYVWQLSGAQVLLVEGLMVSVQWCMTTFDGTPLGMGRENPLLDTQ
jgi:hypothetical protein